MSKRIVGELLIVVGVAIAVHAASGFEGGSGLDATAMTAFGFDDTERVQLTIGVVLTTVGLLLRRR